MIEPAEFTEPRYGLDLLVERGLAELFPGVRAIPLPLVQSGRLARIAVALEIAPGAGTSDMFRTICADADVDPDAAAQALAALRPAVPLDLGLENCVSGVFLTVPPLVAIGNDS